MPIYTLRNKDTGETQERQMSISSKEALIEEGEFEQIHTELASIVSSRGSTLGQTSGDWKDLLKRTKKGSGKGNTINT